MRISVIICCCYRCSYNPQPHEGPFRETHEAGHSGTYAVGIIQWGLTDSGSRNLFTGDCIPVAEDLKGLIGNRLPCLGQDHQVLESTHCDDALLEALEGWEAMAWSARECDNVYVRACMNYMMDMRRWGTPRSHESMSAAVMASHLQSCLLGINDPSD